jgi:thiamine transport system substrate-binding protein
MSGKLAVGISIIALALAACGEADPDTLTIISHDSFAGGVTEETFATFTAQTGIAVEIVPAGDTGSLVNQAILTRENPLADVLFGVDDTFLSRALGADVFRSHHSSLLDRTPRSIRLDPENRVTPIDFGDVCLNYDRAVLVDAAAPRNLGDLITEPFRGQLVVESPATSSPGLAFLLATIAVFGEDGWKEYWQALVDNDVEVVPDWDTAYYSSFSRWGGDRPLVVSYASSPPAEVIYSDPPTEVAPTGVMTDGCYRQIEFAGILEGTEFPEAAGQLIDFMLSVEFQEQIPLTWFVFPANTEATLPPEFVEHTVLPDNPASLDPALIDANRERWIEEWSELVLG